MSISRRITGCLFTAFGALTVISVFWIRGHGDLPDEAVPVIVIATLSAGMTGWLFAHKLATPFRAFAILTGAVVMLGAQIPFAVITTTYFWFFEPMSLFQYGQSIVLLIVGGWAVAGIFQTLTGAAAGWLIHWLGRHDMYRDEYQGE